MEYYNIYFEVASIFVLGLIIMIMSVKRQLNIYKNRLFYRGIVLMLFLNLLDIVSSWIINYENKKPGIDVPIWIGTIVCMGVFLLQQVVVRIFVEYISLMVHPNREKQKIPLFILQGLTGLYFIVVVTTPITKLFFYLDKTNGAYHYGPMHFFMFLVPAICGLYAAGLLLHSKTLLSRTQKSIIVVFAALIFTTLIVQVVFIPKCLITYFVVTITLVGVFLTLQSPDYYLDRTTMAFNHDGLRVMVNDKMSRKEPFSVLLLSICDLRGVKDGFSVENKRLVYRKLCGRLFKLSNTDVFREDDKLYILFYEPDSAEGNEKLVEGWLQEGIVVESLQTRVMVDAKMLVFDFPGRIQKEEEFYSVIKYFLSNSGYNEYNTLQYINEEFFKRKKRYEDVKHLVEEAIRIEGIEMYYQPIYSTQKDRFCSAEALVRMKDTETIGFVSPEEFIPIAEKENLIIQLEDIILRKICSFVKRERLQELGLDYIEINLSGNQCMRADLHKQLSDLIESYGIAPEFINFEVTETSAIDNSECLMWNMQQLQKFGASFALDDYGSGCSNLQYLVEFPFEIVKLDKGIVWTYFGAKNQRIKSVLPLSVDMLHHINVRIVAEGVETEEQKNELISMGVQYLQGYYFSKPINEQEFIAFIKEKNACA
ncbi:MAG: EAL domain-containing protein [Lachnospiraceae bacterium]|nr:EAL domain-containing protein [Lachnospiraceae bacterium]